MITSGRFCLEIREYPPGLDLSLRETTKPGDFYGTKGISPPIDEAGRTRICHWIHEIVGRRQHCPNDVAPLVEQTFAELERLGAFAKQTPQPPRRNA